MADDFQYSPQERPRNGANPLLYIALGIALLGAGGWYLLQSTTSTPTVVAPAPRTISRRTVVSSTSSVGSGTPGALIPTTRLDTALQQAKSNSGKEDPFRTEIVAPAAIKPAPLPKPKPKLKKFPSIVATALPKEFFANGVTVVGIVDTPKENYAIVTYQDRTEIARVGDAIGSAIVKSISARSRTVVFRERGEEITRALEVSQG